MSSTSPYGRIHTRYDSYGFPSGHMPEKKMDKSEKLNLVLTAGVLGICMILFHVFSLLFVKIIKATPIMDYYTEGSILIYTVQIFYSVLSIVIPFAIGGFIISKFLQKDTTLLPLQKPNSGKLVVLSLGMSFLTLVASNFVTSLFILNAESAGFAFEGGESITPNSFSELLWAELSTAVVPALTEEFAVRGIILQSLRRFGDKFAIITSAFIFAIMHGNMVQAPFAFALGLIMGYLVVITGSLWTGVLIHLMNNTYAVVLSAASVVMPEFAYVALVLGINLFGVVLGIIALLIYKDKYKASHPLSEPGGNIGAAAGKYRKQAFFYTLISLPMLAALVLLIVEIAGTITYVG